MIVDIIIILIVLIGFWRGFSKGLIKTIISTIAYFIALILSVKMSHPVAEQLQTYTQSTSAFWVFLSFLLIFILVMLIARLVVSAIEGILKTLSLNLANQLFGGALYAMLLFFALSIILYLLDKSGILPLDWQKDSYLFGFTIQMAPFVIDVLSKFMPVFKDILQRLGSLITIKTI